MLTNHYLIVFLIFILEWDDFVFRNIRLWEEFYLRWLEKGNNIIVVYYENLQKNNFKDITDLKDILNFTLDENRLKCTVKHQDGQFRRKETCIKKQFENIKYGNPILRIQTRDQNQSIYNEQHNIVINSAILKVKRAIIKRGLNPMPLSNYVNTRINITVCL